MSTQLTDAMPPIEDPDFIPGTTEELGRSVDLISRQVPHEQLEWFYEKVVELADESIEKANSLKPKYNTIANSADSYREIAAAIENMEKKTISTHEFSEYEDRYQIIALASLLCYFIGFVIPTKEKNKS